MKDILWPDEVLRLDATSTTSAEIYKLFFNEYKDDVPLFVVIEEIEKTSEEALRVWLEHLMIVGNFARSINGLSLHLILRREFKPMTLVGFWHFWMVGTVFFQGYQKDIVRIYEQSQKELR